MSGKKKHTKAYNPPPKPHSSKVPQKFSSYILLNPSYPVEIVYQLLSHSGKSEPMMIIKGKPEDFKDEPQTMFRTIHEEITLNKTTTNTQ